MKIGTKLIIILIVLMAISMSSVNILTFKLFKNEINDMYQQQTAEKVNLVNDIISERIATPIELVNQVSENIKPFTTKEELSEIHNDLQLRASSVSGILGLHVAFDGDPNLYSSEDISLDADYNANETDWYKEAIANPGEVLITDPYIDSITGNLIVGVSKALAIGDGVVTIDLDLTFLEEAVHSLKVGENGYGFVVDQNGTVLYHPSFEQGTTITDEDYYKQFKSNNHAEMDDENGEHLIINRFHNEEMNWEIGSIYTVDDIRASYSSILKSTITITLVVILVLAAIFYRIVKKAFNLFTSMTKHAEKIAKGNLKDRIQVKNEDEVGLLGKSFNEMSDGLTDMIKSVNQTSTDLNSFSYELSASVEENVQSIHQVVENIQNVANESQEQLYSTKEVKSTVTNMGEEVNQISQHIDDVTNSSSKAESVTKEGVEIIDVAISKMEQIGESAKATATNFTELISVASKIDSFSKVIEDIANQTNLLALNASIEAARAGEHGLGFAVVAEEVRKLAEQTSQTVGEIQGLVATIHTTGKQAQQSIDASGQAMTEGTNQIHEAGKSFYAIREVMQDLTAKVSDVQHAIGNLQQSKDTVILAVDSIAHTAEKVSANVEQVASVSEEQNATMEQLAMSAEQLADKAKLLQDTIQRFETN